MLCRGAVGVDVRGGRKMSDKTEYVIRFISHDEAHEIVIDLEFLAKALLPYLKQEPKP